MDQTAPTFRIATPPGAFGSPAVGVLAMLVAALVLGFFTSARYGVECARQADQSATCAITTRRLGIATGRDVYGGVTGLEVSGGRRKSVTLITARGRVTLSGRGSVAGDAYSALEPQVNAFLADPARPEFSASSGSSGGLLFALGFVGLIGFVVLSGYQRGRQSVEFDAATGTARLRLSKWHQLRTVEVPIAALSELRSDRHNLTVGFQHERLTMYHRDPGRFDGLVEALSGWLRRKGYPVPGEPPA